MQYMYPNQDLTGYRQIVKVGEDLEFCGFELLRFNAGKSFESETLDKEAVLVILSGKCDISVNKKEYTNLGMRKDVFSGNPTSVYVPVKSSFKIREAQGLFVEVAIVTAKAEKQFEPFIVMPEDVVCNNRGILNYKRDVRDIIVANGEGKVHRIIVGETINYLGHWSGYPSHKHDVYNPPYETKMEEIYHFRIKPEGGFGVQVMYNEDLSLRKAYLIKDGDTVILPEGYHPIAAAPGFQVYYLWVMAGEHGRKLLPREDSKLSWLNNVGPLIK